MIDWELLHATAVEAMARAYAPYSNYPVGAAAFADDGRVLSGSNVENAALGVGLCAECGIISDLVRTGGGRLTAFLCVNANKDLILPCGRCRQLLFEHGGPTMMIKIPAGEMTFDHVLPYGFGNDDLEAIR